MNKYLMMSAAAVVASTGAASADTHSFTFGTFSGGSYCDGGTAITGGGVYVWQHTNNNCSGGVSNGQGLLGKKTPVGTVASMSDNYFGAATSIALNYTLPQKWSGKKARWTGWVEFSGTSSFEFNSGPLLNITAGVAKPNNHSKKSTVGAVKTLLAAHRAHKKS